MKRKITIQLKATFLLLVFGLNTIVGFTCSLGLNMSFNTSHHKEDVSATAIHVHAGGKKHEHKCEPVKQHHKEKEIPKKDTEGCCNDDVLKFQNLDKNLNQNSRTAINAPVLVAILNTFLDIDIFHAVVINPQLPVIRYLFPPPPNILISIQRFQI